MRRPPTSIQARVTAGVLAELGRRNLPNAALMPILHCCQASTSHKINGVRKWLLEDVDLIATAWDIPISQLIGEPAVAVTS